MVALPPIETPIALPIPAKEIINAIPMYAKITAVVINYSPF
jgi:hypothetical protein